jgi:ferredoxin
VKLMLNAAACEGNAICCALAPDLFEMNEDDIAEVVMPADLDKSQLPAAQQAVEACPRLAISLLD